MGLILAFILRKQIDLNIGQTGAFTQVIMPYQAVEVEGGTRADIYLKIGYFRYRAECITHFAGHAGGLLQRCAVRGVNDHLQFILVVERQHLDRHRLEVDQRAGEQQQHDDRCQEAVPELFFMDQSPHPATVKSRHL